jgi:F-type H+-transporting ATPase subunit a
VGRTLLILVLAVAAIIAGAIVAPVRLPHIQLAAEPVGHLGGFTLTNTMVAGWLSTIVLLLLFRFGSANQQMVPRGIQNFVEYVTEFVLGLCESIAGIQRGRQFFPIVATIFLFVITSNWMGLLPGFGTIGFWETPHAAAGADTHAPAGAYPAPATKAGYPAPVAAPAAATKAGYPAPAAATKPGYPAPAAGTKDEHAPAAGEHHEEQILVPLLRAASTDLNTTLAIALTSVIATQVFGLRALGGGYISKFINFKGPIDFYVGILELIAEFAKIVSFTFRLFGNIFAGEVLLAVIMFLIPWVAAIPFYGLELFVGFIQAFVFAILTLVFMTLATTAHDHHDDAHGPGHGASHH